MTDIKTPDVARSQIMTREVKIVQTISPLPSAKELDELKKVDPSIPKVIMNAYRKQGEHRRKLELRHQKEQISQNRRPHIETLLGQFYAFVIVMTIIILGYLSITHGHKITGTILSGAGLASIIYMFVSRKKISDKV